MREKGNEKTITVEIITPPRLGGPYFWADNLVRTLSNTPKKNIQATHIGTKSGIVKSLMFRKADIHHTTIPIFPLRKRPTILTIHGEYTIEHPFWKKRYDKTIPKADVVTVPSRFLLEKLNIEAEVIPNAIDTTKFVPKQRKENSLDDLDENEKPVKCVTMASLYFRDKSEGVLKIMKMLNELRKEGNNIEYTVIGAGANLNLLKNEAKKLELPIKFTGYVKNPGKIISNSDIFLYYSKHDNFPLALLEPMACGLPVLTNEVGATKEIFRTGKDGLVAENQETYKKHLEKLIKTKQLRMKLGKEALKQVRTKFDWKKVNKKFSEIYEKYGSVNP